MILSKGNSYLIKKKKMSILPNLSFNSDEKLDQNDIFELTVIKITNTCYQYIFENKKYWKEKNILDSNYDLIEDLGKTNREEKLKRINDETKD